MQCLRSVVSVVLLVGFALHTGVADDVRVGGPASVPDPARFDNRFSDMAEWAKAGVEGGIPLRDDVPVRVTVKPGEDVQRAVDETAQKGYGAVLLEPGRYPLVKRIQMRTGVVLRGRNREDCVLEVTMRAQRRSDWLTYGVTFYGTEWAALEDLTIIHSGVTNILVKVYEGVYGNDLQGTNDLHVGHVAMVGSRNCWIDGCRLLYAGTNPL